MNGVRRPCGWAFGGHRFVEEHDLEFVKGPDGAVIRMLIDGQGVAKRIGGPSIT